MPKNLRFQRLNKYPKHRYSMLRNMAASIFLQERIVTTYGKAKVVVPFVNKLFAKSLINKTYFRDKLSGLIRVRAATVKLQTDLKVRFGSTSGNMLKLTPLFTRRKGDCAEMARVELVKK